MDVTLRIDGLNSANHFEFEVGNEREMFTNTIKYKIHSLHDLLFGIVKIFIKTKGFFFTSTKEVAIFRNIDITEKDGEILIPVIANLNLKEIRVQYSVENMEIEEVKEENHGYIYRILKRLMSQDSLSKLSTAYSMVRTVFEEGAMSLIYGGYTIEKYVNGLNHQMTLDVDLKKSKDMKVCVVKDLVDLYTHEGHQEKSNEGIEGFLLKNKYDYRIIPMAEYLLKMDSQIVETVELPRSTIREKRLNDQMMSKRHCNMKTNLLDTHNHIKPKSNSLVPLERLMSNEDYIVADRLLIEELRHMFYFTIASNGDVRQTRGVKRRREKDSSHDENTKNDENVKAILGFLDIDDKFLLTVSSNPPGFIIFYDKEEKRLVVSFKGTTTLNEVLYDSDCFYTPFYEGFAHRGFKTLAERFVGGKIEKIRKYSEKYNTKDLLLIGYSLGGAVASLVSIILNREDMLPGYNITTYAFAAPPVVSYDLTEVPNAFSISYKNDYIPRISYGSVAELKGICKSLNKMNIEDLRDSGQIYPKLYHIGRVYHFKRVRDGIKSFLLYKEVNREFFENLLILRHSPKHHMIRHLAEVIDECQQQYL